MATYYHGNSEIQGGDGLQTLLLMNPGYVQYSDASSPHPGNFVFHAPPPQTQQLVGIPLTSHQDHNSHSMQEISPLHGFAPRIQYNHWNSVDPNAEARDAPRAQHGLSLSLSSQQVGFGLPLHPQPPVVSGGGSPSSASGVTNGVSGMQSVLTTSKYMKAAQELLDEVVNVGNHGIKADLAKKTANIGESSAAASGDGSVTGEASGAELSTVERQEIQMKKAKLISMLDEVEQRYRQYHHQMQIVTSSFEQVAGAGSAKTYVALALQTISKQFRCLRDAITGQIRGLSKSLGEEDCVGGSRLKLVDHQLRQQRALQQLGMIQHNAWRPQRGLPERSVSVLRAWLFEHFLHPYPKDSDKHMLAKQTGLTRSQVSNWFINARVRLWKPMVEEMYVEELKGQEENGSEDKGENKDDSGSMSHDKSPVDTPSTSPMGGNVLNQSVFTLIGSSELEGMTQGTSPKKQRTLHSPTSASSLGNDVKNGEPNHNDNNHNFIGGFGQYPMGEIGRFDAEQYTPRFSGNGVSLTLGLPHCENLSLSGAHQTLLPSLNMSQLGRRVDQLGEPSEFVHVISTSASHSSSAYEIQNRKRFAAQLLPDFVA